MCFLLVLRAREIDLQLMLFCLSFNQPLLWPKKAIRSGIGCSTRITQMGCSSWAIDPLNGTGFSASTGGKGAGRGSERTFRHSVDVVRGRDILGVFCAVQSSHIRRAQVLRRDLGGRPLAAPVL